ncbi:hypothetical protein H5410_016865 [Solanum commersonii]|uniref:Uncharacterized protein n=1 Tax=Solanum commersonii TaxID=4109 RepID=A0A9J5ZXP4_SOLCO|nr:hypothetical protein H5410_016865 [Solanum commersonii]
MNKINLFPRVWLNTPYDPFGSSPFAPTRAIARQSGDTLLAPPLAFLFSPCLSFFFSSFFGEAAARTSTQASHWRGATATSTTRPAPPARPTIVGHLCFSPLFSPMQRTKATSNWTAAGEEQ